MKPKDGEVSSSTDSPVVERENSIHWITDSIMVIIFFIIYMYVTYIIFIMFNEFSAY